MYIVVEIILGRVFHNNSKNLDEMIKSGFKIHLNNLNEFWKNLNEDNAIKYNNNLNTELKKLRDDIISKDF